MAAENRLRSAVMTTTRAALLRLAVLAIVAAALLPGAAQAYWRGGVFFGFPAFYVAPPPVYYYPPPAYYYPPPPVYVAPAPAYSAPPTASNGPPPPAQACYAGPWVCPLSRPTASGDSCACAGTNGRTWGQAR
jgi:hypothetical protein